MNKTQVAERLSEFVTRTDCHQHGLNAKDKGFLSALLAFHDPDLAGIACSITMRQLEKSCGCSVSTLKRTSKRLQEKGYIKVQSGKRAGEANLYSVNAELIVANAVASGVTMPKRAFWLE